jgi:6-phosphogluconolactonase
MKSGGVTPRMLMLALPSLPPQPWFKAPAGQVHVIAPALPAPECAAEYEGQIRALFATALAGATPAFDLILLGMGPDGHTASLFPGAGLARMCGDVARRWAGSGGLLTFCLPPTRPTPPLAGHPLLAEASCLIAPITDSPKPPPTRVTFTYRLINEAAAVAFVALGEGKAGILAQVMDGAVAAEAALPAARVRQARSKAPTWFTDAAACSKLPGVTPVASA